MRSLIPLALLICLFSACNPHNSKTHHLGGRVLSDTEIRIDSILIPADTTSLRGNFVLMDSSLMFVDNMYCRIFEYNLNDGKLTHTYSGYGQGPNEMTGIMYGSVVHPADTSMLIFDSSNGVYEFIRADGRVEYKGQLDFSWDSGITDDYHSPSCYRLMEMSDFGVSLNQISDSAMLIPLSLINRRLDGLTAQRYEQGRIFGKVNPESYKVTDVTGAFPDIYKERPMPAFEFFDYAVDHDNSRIYVNHSPDPLIYCCDLDGNILHSLGFEPEGIDRDYTIGFEPAFETFGKDIAHVGTNTGLYYDSAERLLFRTTMADFASGKVMMQVYRDNDLIHEKEMPTYFKLLGKHGPNYYGVRFLPLDEGNQPGFILYKLSLTA